MTMTDDNNEISGNGIDSIRKLSEAKQKNYIFAFFTTIWVPSSPKSEESMIKLKKVGRLSSQLR